MAAKKKKKTIASKGYRVGSVDELLGLSADEMEYIELKTVPQPGFNKAPQEK